MSLNNNEAIIQNGVIESRRILPIYNCYHPVLHQKTQEITEITPEIVQLVENMFKTLHNTSNGVGLAANQVGISSSLFIIDVSELEEYPDVSPFVCINPEIIEYSKQTNFYDEGCLSVPNLYEEIERPESVKIKYFDLEMKENIKSFNGFLARVVQHEYDHLQGIVFYEKLSAFQRALCKNKLRNIKNNKIDVDYPMVDATGAPIGL